MAKKKKTLHGVKISEGRRFKTRSYQPNEFMTHGVSLMIGRLFLQFYHIGVMEAYERHDYGEAREFLALMDNATDEWGMLGTPVYTRVEYWMLKLGEISDSISRQRTMREYLVILNRYGASFLSVLLPLAMDFYCMGIRDYWADPTAREIEWFRSDYRSLWVKEGKAGKAKSTFILDHVHKFCLDRPAYEKLRGLNPNHYEIFRRVFTICFNRKY